MEYSWLTMLWCFRCIVEWFSYTYTCIYSFISLTRYFLDNCGPSAWTRLTDYDIVERLQAFQGCVSESEVCTQAFVCPLSLSGCYMRPSQCSCLQGLLFLMFASYLLCSYKVAVLRIVCKARINRIWEMEQQISWVQYA